MEKIGLIAGNRKFPLLFCQAARKRGVCVIAIALKGDTSRQINKLASKVYWLKIQEYSRLFEIFKSEGIKKIVMAGQISPRRLFSKELYQDTVLRSILEMVKDKKADTIFGAIADKLKAAGFTLEDSSLFMEEYFPRKGVLTQREPGAEEWDDIHFGFRLAKEMGLLDVGQTVAVKHKAVVAVEAFEGTDNLIRRAGKLSRGGMTVVKVSKPAQDLRFDIPVVGLHTIKSLIRAKAACLAIEAGKTLFIDKEESLKAASRSRLVIAAV